MSAGRCLGRRRGCRGHQIAKSFEYSLPQLGVRVCFGRLPPLPSKHGFAWGYSPRLLSSLADTWYLLNALGFKRTVFDLSVGRSVMSTPDLQSLSDELG
jgi:hypothetical protein